MRLLFIAALLLSGQLTHAQTTTVEGILKIDKSGERFLQMRTGLMFPLEPGNNQTSQELSRIQNGDFLFGIGDLGLQNRTISLHSIEKVGLRKLLGDWKSDQGGVFSFRSFSQVVLSDRKYQDESSAGRQSSSMNHVTYRLNYHVSPSAGSTWSIFLVDRDNVTIGRFRFFGDRLKMYFIDESTGNITQRLKLTKLDSSEE